MKEPKHKHVGVILSRKWSDGPLMKGTGFAVSSNIVLTAAHNLYETSKDKQIGKHIGIKYYPGQEGLLTNYY